ncbi:GNAT family N-acetyltransferase [Rhizobium tumorigenes]|uniref:GNAT family N-acetyltransferase n=1 Tax=Rhizobium tumorigenes TaxID=2041385 RepID=A0AAF1KJI0_9HYPH|nr:GNAT family N-acetyltransferase [Rhizobium tumorigenes]WFR96195.1 GNAT family N-acetyltransferase [Rhizobium tumorigenes]
MEFREAVADDAANVAALTTQVFLHTYAKRGVRTALSTYVLSEFTADKFRQAVEDEQQMFIVCEEDNHLVGYVRLAFKAPCPSDDRLQSEIATLYVQEHFLRRGIGTQLLNRALQTFQHRGAAAAWLSVNHENADAVAFYERHGFQRAGSTDFELDGERHENFILRRALDEG